MARRAHGLPREGVGPCQLPGAAGSGGTVFPASGAIHRRDGGAAESDAQVGAMVTVDVVTVCFLCSCEPSLHMYLPFGEELDCSPTVESVI